MPEFDQLRKTPEGYFTTRWGQPEYTDWQDESMSWKEGCYIGDWSFLWERRFRGPDVLKLFADTSVNNFAKFDLNQSKHVIHTDKNGKLIAEGILTRLGEDEHALRARHLLGGLQPAPRRLRRDFPGGRLVQLPGAGARGDPCGRKGLR
ncbi:hypothetical protein ACFSZS_30370 [Seohaeicola zhoushanensis]